jgi:hypothetical protein
MKRIGEPAFTFRLPAIVDGGLARLIRRICMANGWP